MISKPGQTSRVCSVADLFEEYVGTDADFKELVTVLGVTEEELPKPLQSTKPVSFVKTFTATVYVGLKEGYDGKQFYCDDVIDELQEYVNRVGLCVTITPTVYLYKGGWEHGVAIGLIQYPRFPTEEIEIRKHAENIARCLKGKFKQNRVSIVFPDETIMLE